MKKCAGLLILSKIGKMDRLHKRYYTYRIVFGLYEILILPLRLSRLLLTFLHDNVTDNINCYFCNWVRNGRDGK